ncbi:unnamed protein product [Symbiodinium sp. CCMP2592]|nr:unnamed protein product [Symbiodinium sp. CCMP2592]
MASEGTEAAGSSAGGALNNLPWQQIPKFTPGSTNSDEYPNRLQFIRDLWPDEHIHLLGPRAALMVEASAFQKVSRIPADKLKNKDGVKILGAYNGGRQVLLYFERAIFQTQQKSDESIDSYVAWHDAHFEELISHSVQLEEVRAHVLLRQSPEDKRKVIVEAGGDLTYAGTVKGSARGQERNKVYDINLAEDDGIDEAHVAVVPESEPSDEEIVAFFMEQNDEDAMYIAEFEDHMVDAAREKARNRGYFPVGGRGRGKGKSGTRQHKGSAFDGGRRRSLAERIASSNCKLCGKKGQARDEGNKKEVTLYSQTENLHLSSTEVLHSLPEDAELYFATDGDEDFDENRGDEAQIPIRTAARENRIQSEEQMCLAVFSPKVPKSPDFLNALACRLVMPDRTARQTATRLTGLGQDQAPASVSRDSEQGSCGEVLQHAKPYTFEDPVALVVTHGAEGVLDTDASRTVVRSRRVNNILQGLPSQCRDRARKARSDVTFRFGNSGTLTAEHALLLPTAEDTWIRVEVVPGDTPLLISNRLLYDVDAVVHVRKGVLEVGGRTVELRRDERGLSLVDLTQLLPGNVAPILLSDGSLPQQHSIDRTLSPQPPVDQHFCAFIAREDDHDRSEEHLAIDQYLTVHYVKPPHISTLRQWEEVVLPQGKHKHKTHNEVFSNDLTYAILMARKTSLTSSGALSFKNYSLARWKGMAQAAQDQINTDAKKPTTSHGPGPKASKGSKASSAMYAKMVGDSIVRINVYLKCGLLVGVSSCVDPCGTIISPRSTNAW